MRRGSSVKKKNVKIFRSSTGRSGARRRFEEHGLAQERERERITTPWDGAVQHSRFLGRDGAKARSPGHHRAR